MFQPARDGLDNLVAVALKALFFEAVLDDPDRARGGPALPLVGYVADEFHRFVTSDPLHGEQSFLDTCRSFGAFCVLACQSVASIEHALAHGGGSSDQNRAAIEILLSNTANKFVFRSTHPSTAHRVLDLGPRRPGRPGVAEVRPVSALRVGEAYVALSDGRFERRQLKPVRGAGRGARASRRAPRRPARHGGPVMSGRPACSRPVGRPPGECDALACAASASLLTGLYGLCHNAWTTPEEAAEVERRGACLTPELWRETRRLLRDADQGADGTRIELGFTELLLRWLGYRDECAFASAHGVGIADALARGRGRLGTLAEIVESGGGGGAEALRRAVGDAWVSRAAHLMDGLPETAPGAVEALERALGAFPWPARNRRALLGALVSASEACGDEARAGSARRALEAVDHELAARDPTPMYRAAATLLTCLWCIAHDDGLLAAERGLDPGIEPAPETWTKARAALEAGRPGDVPLPVRTFDAWSAGAGLDEGELRVCLEEAVRAHPDLPRMVELLWDRSDPDEEVPREAAWYAVDAAFQRRLGVERDYRPLPGERQNVYFEIHQGARRAHALEGVALMRRLHLVLCRGGGIDPMAVASVCLDLAVDCEAQGAHEAARRHLVAAVDHAQGVEGDAVRRDYPEVCLATWHWHSGEVGEAVRRLERLEGPQAVEARRQIEAKAPEREALRVAQGARAQRRDVRSACEVLFAHLRAGHYVAAERHARELCEASPGSPHAWAALASVLHDQGRYRDAVQPARNARSAGYDELAGSALLARILRGLGSEGREESRALARQALAADAAGGGLDKAARAELERIAGEGQGDG